MEYWRAYIENRDSMTCNASCYESSIRYPTDVKLLWESVLWTYVQLCAMSKQAKVRRLRTKFKKWEKRYVAYSKLRCKPSSRRRRMTRALLDLLEKILSGLTDLEAL